MKGSPCSPLMSPGLRSMLLAAKMAGYAHVIIDGTVIGTDRCRTFGPTPGMDLWWSGKHDSHGVNVQQHFNRAHNAGRAIGERRNSRLKTTFNVLRNVSLGPWSIGRITAVALVIVHIDHHHTTWSPHATARYSERLTEAFPSNGR